MASSPSPVLSAEQRAWQYWFDDGLPTLVAGAGCLLFALSFAYGHSRNATPLTIVICFVALLLYFVVSLFQRQIIDWLKSRITYPRTGYAQPPYVAEEATPPFNIVSLSIWSVEGKRPEDIEPLHTYRSHRLLFTWAAIGAATVAMMLIPNRWICAVAGLVIALALWIWGRKVQRLSWIILSGFPLIGFYVAIFHANQLGGTNRVSFFLAGAGLLLFVDGMLTLLRYLRANPRPTQP